MHNLTASEHLDPSYTHHRYRQLLSDPGSGCLWTNPREKRPCPISEPQSEAGARRGWYVNFKLHCRPLRKRSLLLRCFLITRRHRPLTDIQNKRHEERRSVLHCTNNYNLIITIWGLVGEKEIAAELTVPLQEVTDLHSSASFFYKRHTPLLCHYCFLMCLYTFLFTSMHPKAAATALVSTQSNCIISFGLFGFHIPNCSSSVTLQQTAAALSYCTCGDTGISSDSGSHFPPL